MFDLGGLAWPNNDKIRFIGTCEASTDVDESESDGDSASSFLKE